MIVGSGMVTTLAGSGNAGSVDGVGSSASFNNPAALSVSSSGLIYVADTYNNKIRTVTGDFST